MIASLLISLLLTLAPQKLGVRLLLDGVIKKSARWEGSFSVRDSLSHQEIHHFLIKEGQSIFGVHFLRGGPDGFLVYSETDGRLEIALGLAASVTFTLAKPSPILNWTDFRWQSFYDRPEFQELEDLIRTDWSSKNQSLYAPSDAGQCDTPIQRERSLFESRWLEAMEFQEVLRSGADLTLEAIAQMKADPSLFFGQNNRILKLCHLENGAEGVCCGTVCTEKKEIQPDPYLQCRATDSCGQANPFYDSALDGRACEVNIPEEFLGHYLPASSGAESESATSTLSGLSDSLANPDNPLMLKAWGAEIDLKSTIFPAIPKDSNPTSEIPDNKLPRVFTIKGSCRQGTCLPFLDSKNPCMDIRPRLKRNSDDQSLSLEKVPRRNGTICGENSVCQDGECIPFEKSRRPKIEGLSSLNPSCADLNQDDRTTTIWQKNGSGCPVDEDVPVDKQWKGFCYFGHCLSCEAGWESRYGLACPDLPKEISRLDYQSAGKRLSCSHPDICHYEKMRK